MRNKFSRLNILCNLKISMIKRHHIIGFWDRLIKRISACNTVKKVRDILRTISGDSGICGIWNCLYIFKHLWYNIFKEFLRTFISLK